MTRDQAIKICRESVEGINRPTYCKNPPTFDPHEWVIDAVLKAYRRGLEDRSGS